MKKTDDLAEVSDGEVARLLLSAARERAPRGAKRRALLVATAAIAASAPSNGNAVVGNAASLAEPFPDPRDPRGPSGA